MISGLVIKGVASYDEAGIAITDLAKINFIYGANGSGKTTISNFLSGGFPERYKKCSLLWGGGGAIDVLVYNKEFRERNFGKSTIEGVFTLGEAAINIQDEVEEKQKRLQCIAEDGKIKRETQNSLKENLAKEEEVFKEKVWSAYYKSHEEDFRSAFKGNAQKESFKQKLISESANSLPPELTLEKMQELAKTALGIRLKRLSRFDGIRECSLSLRIFRQIVCGLIKLSVKRMSIFLV